jgi:hypothetical protein
MVGKMDPYAEIVFRRAGTTTAKIMRGPVKENAGANPVWNWE